MTKTKPTAKKNLSSFEKDKEWRPNQGATEKQRSETEYRFITLEVGYLTTVTPLRFSAQEPSSDP